MDILCIGILLGFQNIIQPSHEKNNENSARERAFKWLSANFLVERATERPPFAQKDQWLSVVQCQLKSVDPPILPREKGSWVDKKSKNLLCWRKFSYCGWWVMDSSHNVPNVSTENLNEESVSSQISGNAHCRPIPTNSFQFARRVVSKPTILNPILHKFSTKLWNQIKGVKGVSEHDVRLSPAVLFHQ